MKALTDIFDALKVHQQRGLVRLIGDPAWAKSQIDSFLKTSGGGTHPNEKNESHKVCEIQVGWFTQPPSNENTSQPPIPKAEVVRKSNEWRLKKYPSFLGKEFDIIVMDLHQGLNLEAIGALAGTIKLGGALILITPEDEHWLSMADPEAQRIASYPDTFETVSNHFIQHFIRQLHSQVGILTINQHEQRHNSSSQQRATMQQLSRLRDTQVSEPDEHLISLGYKSRDQAIAGEAMFKALSQKEKVAVTLIADRGRGKSALLGQLLSRLFPTPSVESSVVVVSSSNDSLSVLKKQYYDHCGVGDHPLPFHIMTADRALEHTQLSSMNPHYDIVIIDEAASYPLHIIQSLVKASHKVVMASTIHGYEGTGRGFEYKLMPWLREQFLNCDGQSRLIELSMTTPIRWNKGDHLEQWINQTLYLDLELPSTLLIPRHVNDLKHGITTDLILTKVTKPELVGERLASIFSLLVHAHYQTTPSDLRALLDAPNMDVYEITLKSNAQAVLGTILVSTEGHLPTELSHEIWAGRRRPRGHLAPQSLMAHCGYKDAGEFGYSRIVRVAVHPKYQSIGIGSFGLRALRNELSNDNNIHYLATSFGASQSLVQFWSDNGFAPVRLGLRPETSTAEYSILMLSNVSRAGSLSSMDLLAATRLNQWSRRFEYTLQAEQAINYRMIPAQDGEFANTDFSSIYSLFEPLTTNVGEIDDWNEQQHLSDIDALAHHFRSPDSCVLAMVWLITVSMKDKKNDSLNPSLPLLIDKYKKAITSKELVKKYGFSGEKALVNALRLGAQRLLKCR